MEVDGATVYFDRDPRRVATVANLLSSSDLPLSGLSNESSNFVVPPHLFASEPYIFVEEEEEVPPRSDGSPSSSVHGRVSPVHQIYSRLDSFQRRLQTELHNLEKGVPNEATKTQKKPPANGNDAQTTSRRILTASAFSRDTPKKSKKSNNNKGKQSKNLAMLSSKTAQIMEDYSTYIEKIQSGFSQDNCEQTELACNHQVRKYDVERRSMAEEGINQSLVVARDNNNCAVEALLPLQREWSYDDDNAGHSGTLSFFGEQHTERCVHSKWIKRGLGMIVMLVVVVGCWTLLSVGLTSGNRTSESFPEQKQEDKVEVEVKEQTVHSAYYQSVLKYKPVLFDRNNGWNGRTYREALFFCGKRGLTVCPYDAVCPLEDDGEPFGGFREGPKGDWAWMPIIEKHNEWVQAGAREKCVKYSSKFGDVPDWGITGQNGGVVDVESITQNLMCCHNVM
jgi:hypothetical protein